MEIPLEQVGISMISLIRRHLPHPFHLSRARRFFFLFCDNLSFAHHIRYAIQNADSLESVERLFRAYFEEVPTDRFKSES